MKRVNIAVITMPGGTLSVRTDMTPRQAYGVPHTELTPAQVLARRMMSQAYFPKYRASVNHGGAAVPLVALAHQLLQEQDTPIAEIHARLRTALGLCPVEAAAAAGS